MRIHRAIIFAAWFAVLPVAAAQACSPMPVFDHRLVWDTYPAKPGPPVTDGELHAYLVDSENFRSLHILAYGLALDFFSAKLTKYAARVRSEVRAGSCTAAESDALHVEVEAKLEKVREDIALIYEPAMDVFYRNVSWKNETQAKLKACKLAGGCADGI